ncbi:unnamed protein product [Taenia asiatica]|uniref:Hexosyltransferase n=1 Tax=Taenia asiatica TaxID=60517 RepID=A0A0R3WG65_TAEAS|nr:unnamed protein product [Taenia asiatica]
MKKHDDLLVGDYEDSYYNLSLKLFHTFRWTARLCRPYRPTFVFLDDDYAVNTNKFVNFILGLTPKLRDNLNHGSEVMVNPVFRNTSRHPQWALSKREIPWPMHPPEYLGIYSMWSCRHVHDMALAIHFTKPMVIDDAWLEMLQYRLNLTFTSLKGMFRHTLSMHQQVNCSDIFFAPLDEFKQRQCVL